jgi:histidyl-tRNA synthetase
VRRWPLRRFSGRTGRAGHPGGGLAIGLERLTLLLEALEQGKATAPDIYLVSRGEQAEANALQLAQNYAIAG